MTSATKSKTSDHIRLSYTLNITEGHKGMGRAHHLPALPAVPNGTAKLSVTGSAHGGVLSLQISDAEFPDGRWSPVASALVEGAEGELVATVPERVGNGMTVNWLRGFYGAQPPPDPTARLRNQQRHPGPAPAITPHTVVVTIEIEGNA